MKKIQILFTCLSMIFFSFFSISCTFRKKIIEKHEAWTIYKFDNSVDNIGEFKREIESSVNNYFSFKKTDIVSDKLYSTDVNPENPTEEDEIISTSDKLSPGTNYRFILTTQLNKTYILNVFVWMGENDLVESNFDNHVINSDWGYGRWTDGIETLTLYTSHDNLTDYAAFVEAIQEYIYYYSWKAFDNEKELSQNPDDFKMELIGNGFFPHADNNDEQQRASAEAEIYNNNSNEFNFANNTPYYVKFSTLDTITNEQYSDWKQADKTIVEGFVCVKVLWKD